MPPKYLMVRKKKKDFFPIFLKKTWIETHNQCPTQIFIHWINIWITFKVKYQTYFFDTFMFYRYFLFFGSQYQSFLCCVGNRDPDISFDWKKLLCILYWCELTNLFQTFFCYYYFIIQIHIRPFQNLHFSVDISDNHVIRSI